MLRRNRSSSPDFQSRNSLLNGDIAVRSVSRPISATSSAASQSRRLSRRATSSYLAPLQPPTLARTTSATKGTCAPVGRERRAQSSYDTINQARAARMNRRQSSKNFVLISTNQPSAREDEKAFIDKERCARRMHMWSRVVIALIKLHRASRNSLFEGTLYRQQLEHIDRTLGSTATQSEQQPPAQQEQSDSTVDSALYNPADFNPSDFKANRQMRLSEKAKIILSKPPADRSEEDIYYATLALRNIHLIAEYPVRMQRKLAQYGVFQSFGARRVIVRQGQPPFAFYFILYGTVVVAAANDDVQDAKTLCHLRRDDSFGELSIMNGTIRQSTVITQDEVELLAIDVQTYEQIFMVGGSKNINDPDHSQFMDSLSFLKGFPLVKLEEQPEDKNVVFHYFKRDAVMVRDSNYNDWIYVVKSGSVQVLKKLVRTEPTVDLKTGKLGNVTTDADLLLGFTCGRKSLERLMNDCGQVFQKPIMDKIIAERTFDQEQNENDKDLTLLKDYSFSIKENLKTRRCQSAIIRTHGRGNQPSVYRETRSKTFIESSLSVNFQNSVPLELKQNSELARNGTQGDEQEQEKRRTFIDDLDSGFAARRKSDRIDSPQANVRTPADKHPMFVHVQTLTKGDVFGLAPFLFPEQPSMCLVSNGVECILIKRSFYRDHVPTSVIRRLKCEMSPYPTEENLQEELQIAVNWMAYKRATLNDTRRRLRTNKNSLKCPVTT